MVIYEESGIILVIQRKKKFMLPGGAGCSTATKVAFAATKFIHEQSLEYIFAVGLLLLTRKYFLCQSSSGTNIFDVAIVRRGCLSMN